MNEEQIWELIEEGENAELECKLAEGGVPKDLWPTYSAFANTNGGIILLGIKEDRKNNVFTPQDVDVEKLQKDFWDNINNSQKISRNILLNHHVQPIKIGGKNVLKIVVPRAAREEKPIYYGQNPYVGTFRRNYEGDYRCLESEVNRMIAERTNESQDDKILKNFSLSDLNMASLKSYRKRFAVLKPDNHWNGLEDVDFLRRIGGWRKDREVNIEGLTVAGLLMFGEEEAIISRYPHYFLDYREKMSSIPSERWSDRITSQDGNWSGNLYDFYFKVIGKLTSDINVPFFLEGDELMRQSDTSVHKALREAVLNALIHANYSADVGVVIEKEKSYFRFSNPGILRMPMEKAVEGGNSDPRNPNIFRMFFHIGLGERSGYGLESIHKTWKQQHWRKPALEEEFRPERTTLTLLSSSLLPDDVVNYFELKLKDRFHLLSSEEVLILVTAFQEKSVSNARMQQLMNMHSQDIVKLLSNLVHEGLLVGQGYGRGTKYVLSEILTSNGEVIIENSSDEGNNRERTGNNGERTGNNGERTGNNGERTGNNGERTGNNGEQTGNYERLSVQRVKEIDNLYEIAKKAREKQRIKPAVMKDIIVELCQERFLTIKELTQILVRDRSGIRKYLHELVEENRIKLRYPNTPSVKNQAYKSTDKNE